MIFHVLTIFPEFFRGPFDHGVLRKAAEAGRLGLHVHDLRNWTYDRHRTVDDRPFGGGEGMLLKPQPLFEAVEAIWPGHTKAERGGAAGLQSPASGRKVLLLSAQGKRFTQPLARQLARCDELLLICGRYEGVDERVADHLADEEICVGDFVLSGGELAAAIVVDVVARLLPGVLGNEASTAHESFGDRDDMIGVLDCPQYTRPADFRGWTVPEVLLSGNHAAIAAWRQQTAREKTARMRPDLLDEDRG